MKRSFPMRRHIFQPADRNPPRAAALPDLTRKAAAALAGLALIGLQSQYDLAAFRLRGLLQQIDRLPPSLLDLTDPDATLLLWRLQILDRHCDTHFLTGLPNLAAWGNRLLAQVCAADLHAPMAAQRFLSQQRHLGGLLANHKQDLLWQPLFHAC